MKDLIWNIKSGAFYHSAEFLETKISYVPWQFGYSVINFDVSKEKE